MNINLNDEEVAAIEQLLVDDIFRLIEDEIKYKGKNESLSSFFTDKAIAQNNLLRKFGKSIRLDGIRDIVNKRVVL